MFSENLSIESFVSSISSLDKCVENFNLSQDALTNSIRLWNSSQLKAAEKIIFLSTTRLATVLERIYAEIHLARKAASASS